MEKSLKHPYPAFAHQHIKSGYQRDRRPFDHPGTRAQPFVRQKGDHHIQKQGLQIPHMEAIGVIVFQHRQQILRRRHKRIRAGGKHSAHRRHQLHRCKHDIDQHRIGHPRQQQRFRFLFQIRPRCQRGVARFGQRVAHAGQHKQQRHMKPVHKQVGDIAPRRIGAHRLAEGVPENDQQHRHPFGDVHIVDPLVFLHTRYLLLISRYSCWMRAASATISYPAARTIATPSVRGAGARSRSRMRCAHWSSV